MSPRRAALRDGRGAAGRSLRPALGARPGGAGSRSRVASFLVTTLLAALLCAPDALAHDVWLQVQPLGGVTPAAGDRLPLDLHLGDAVPGTVLPRRASRVLRFDLVDPAGRVTALPGVDGAAPAAVAALSSAGDYAAVYEGNAAFIEVPAEIFESYLADEGLDAVRRQRAEAGASGRPGRELYSRSLKTLWTVEGTEGATDGTPSPHLRPTGLPLELVPERRPADLEPGDEVTLRLLLDGEPLAGALVQALPLDLALPGTRVRTASLRRRTGADGRVTFRLDRAALWRFTCVRMRPATPQDHAATETLPADAPAADWRSVWTALTFEVRPPRRRAAAMGPVEVRPDEP